MIKRGGTGSAFKCQQQACVFLNILSFKHLNDEAECCEDSRDTLAGFRPVGLVKAPEHYVNVPVRIEI